MEDQEIRKLIAYYDEEFIKIWAHPLMEKVTVRSAHLSSRALQQAYKEMRALNFNKGNIIDYLCYICLLEFVRYAVNAKKIGLKSKKIISFLDTYLEINIMYYGLIWRLIIKDNSFLEDAFKNFGITKEDELFIEVDNRMNYYMVEMMAIETNRLMKSKFPWLNKD